MSKTPYKVGSPELSRFCKSTFTLTFAVEVLGIDVWHDCNEGWLDLGPCEQGMKMQYQLYPGQTYDLDIMIWPHVAKVWCGDQYGWVRTWQFLERRWLTFSIRHAFPVRVTDLQKSMATISPSVGLGILSANAKNDKTLEVYLPPLVFLERRYFAPVMEGEESISSFIAQLVWKAIEEYIPPSYLDGLFDVPYTVTDVRHQDAALYFVQETILRRIEPEVIEEPPDVEEPKPRVDRRESKVVKEKDKKKVETAKVKFGISISGDTILSGTGRVIPFEVVGEKPSDLGEIIVLISSNNLPAQDDIPILFFNIDNLTDIPTDHLKKVRISQLYTRWTVGEEVHDSKPQIVKNKPEMKFNDHHALPLALDEATQIVAPFLDDPYQIELRGIRSPPPINANPIFFGYEKGDRDFGSAVPTKTHNHETDIIIAVTKIDARLLTRGINTFIKGEYPLYPPQVSVEKLERERICTNDINAVRALLKPALVVPPGIVLEAQMTLEVSIGLVGCKPRKMLSYSRLFCLISDPEAIMAILREITVINELGTKQKDDLLTGFALDTGDVVLLYIEGPRDGQILRVWDMTEDYYPLVKPVYSSAAKYCTRLYPELLLAAMPFNILKMFVPLSVLLACPSVYARPALPLPTRAAVLKIGRLIASKLLVTPCRSEMPTTMELKSFRLELCVAPRPSPITTAETPSLKVAKGVGDPCKTSLQSVSRINWENKQKVMDKIKVERC